MAVGVTCASLPLLGLAQVRELPQKGGLGAVAYQPGQTLYLGCSDILHLQVTDVNFTPYLALRRH